MIEELADTRSMFDSGEFAEVVSLGSNTTILGIFDSNFDESLAINGQRVGLRCVNVDVADLATGASITIESTEAVYIVREKQVGARTTLLILERT